MCERGNGRICWSDGLFSEVFIEILRFLSTFESLEPPYRLRACVPSQGPKTGPRGEEAWVFGRDGHISRFTRYIGMVCGWAEGRWGLFYWGGRSGDWNSATAGLSDRGRGDIVNNSGYGQGKMLKWVNKVGGARAV